MRGKANSTAHGWERYLDADETLIWTGSPEQRWSFGERPLFTIPFGLAFCVLPGSILFGTIRSEGFGSETLAVGLIILPFLVVGFSTSFGKPIYRYHLLKHTRYALTTLRCIIATNFFGRKLKSYRLSPDMPINLAEHRDTASVFFARTPLVVHRHKGQSQTSGNEPVGFQFLKDGLQVYRQLCSLTAPSEDADGEGA